jgi:hypothetical protein
MGQKLPIYGTFCIGTWWENDDHIWSLMINHRICRLIFRQTNIPKLGRWHIFLGKYVMFWPRHRWQWVKSLVPNIKTAGGYGCTSP